SFSTWLTRIAINSALMTLREKRSSRETSIGFGESDPKRLGWDVPDPSPNPEKACAQRERERLLREAIRDLRQTIRRVVEIQQVRELSMKETARMDGRLSDSGEGAAVSRETGTEESIAANNKRARGRNDNANQTEGLRTCGSKQKILNPVLVAIDICDIAFSADSDAGKTIAR